MNEHADLWPDLPYDDLTPTVDHLRRLVQIAGKYTLDQAFEPGWGNVVFDITPRGLRTPTLRRDDVTFVVHYRLLDGDVVLEANTGVRALPLRPQSVAEFYAAFVAAAAELGLAAPGSTITAEIAGAAPLDADRAGRPWDPAAARLIWAGLNVAAGALEEWQASYRGHRPRVGVMWGGFDLSATRYRGAAVIPPADRPVFMQYGMAEEYVAVGFSFGSPDSPAAAIYGYIAPQPAGLEGRSWGAEGAAWIPGAGLATLPWEALRVAPDPRAVIITFADAVYGAAVDLAGPLIWSVLATTAGMPAGYGPCGHSAVRAGRGSSMTSKPVALLLADSVSPSPAAPNVSNDCAPTRLAWPDDLRSAGSSRFRGP